jgi:pimeloyl-ACP methyl ester carboxylesterase
MIWTTRPRSSVGQLAAITSGSGPLIVMIHGVGLKAEAWGAQIEELSGTFCVIAVDLPGHGSSAHLSSVPNLTNFVDAIVGVIDAPAVIIGHSFGAMIALELTARHPQLVRGVVALNAIYRRDQDAKAAVTARANSLDGVSVADLAGPLNRWFGEDASAEREACGSWLREADPAGYRHAYQVFAAQDGASDADLRSIHCPALFMTGEDEPNSTPAMSRAMANISPRGKAEIIRGAAHMMPMTHAPQVNAILRDFSKAAFA